MNVLVVGAGGREHAICRALRTSPRLSTLLIAPGNPGTAALGENLQVSASDSAAIVRVARERQVAFVVVGPEQPLVDGLADVLTDAGIPCVGPSARAARLEGSKAFMRTCAAHAGIASPEYRIVRAESELEYAVRDFPGVPVVKADGLAAGKGVFLPSSKAEAMEIGRKLLAGALGAAGKTLVLEERLTGVEASLFFACDGRNVVALPHARDHKRLSDGDVGPNTGGMGAISPNPDITPSLVADIEERFAQPTLNVMRNQDAPFRGFLFAGLMLTPEGPKLLEYNVRLGDPEAQAILPRLAPGTFFELCERMARGALDGFAPAVEANATCAVVLAADGYPDAPRAGDAITVDESIETPQTWLIHAGTRLVDGTLVTAGGRVAAVVAAAANAAAARELAYGALPKVNFHGRQVRRDIGASSQAR